jgi:hypothetical protein
MKSGTPYPSAVAATAVPSLEAILRPLHALGPWAPVVLVAALASTTTALLARFYRPRRYRAAERRYRTAARLRDELLARADRAKAERLVRSLDGGELAAARAAYRTQWLLMVIPSRILPILLGLALVTRAYGRERLLELFGRDHVAAVPLSGGHTWLLSAPQAFLLVVVVIWLVSLLVGRGRAAGG